MKLYYVLTLLLFTISVQSQILDKGVLSVGYRYTGRNIIQGGLSYKVNDATTHSFVVGASAIYTSVENKTKFLPEGSFYYTNTIGYLLGVSVNPYSVEPRIGLSLFNFMYLNTGYALPINTEKYFKGITFGVQFNIAPVKSSKFYDHLKLM